MVTSQTEGSRHSLLFVNPDTSPWDTKTECPLQRYSLGSITLPAAIGGGTPHYSSVLQKELVLL